MLVSTLSLLHINRQQIYKKEVTSVEYPHDNDSNFGGPRIIK